MACDLREAGEACLPAGVGDMVKSRVEGKMVVQVGAEFGDGLGRSFEVTRVSRQTHGGGVLVTVHGGTLETMQLRPAGGGGGVTLTTFFTLLMQSPIGKRCSSAGEAVLIVLRPMMPRIRHERAIVGNGD